jgi:hypothetical protein
METLQAVVDLFHENSELKERLSKFEDKCEDLVGQSVTFRVRHSRKYKFYDCIVDKFTGEGWELIQDTDYDRPIGFYATFDDLFKGNFWINKSK